MKNHSQLLSLNSQKPYLSPESCSTSYPFLQDVLQDIERIYVLSPIIASNIMPCGTSAKVC